MKPYTLIGAALITYALAAVLAFPSCTRPTRAPVTPTAPAPTTADAGVTGKPDASDSDGQDDASACLTLLCVDVSDGTQNCWIADCEDADILKALDKVGGAPRLTPPDPEPTPEDRVTPAEIPTQSF